MRDYTKINDSDLLAVFNQIMRFNIDDVGKTVRELSKSYPNDFWSIYRQIEYRQIYKKRESSRYIGIVGSRRRNEEEDFKLIHQAFLKLYNPQLDIVVVSGLCQKGADRFAAERIYQKYRTRKIWFKPEWNLGGHAGFVRNTEIARWSDFLIATPATDRKGGTEDTIKKWNGFNQDNLENLTII